MGPPSILLEPYANPPRAKQRGSSSTLDSGDDRMQQASFVNGTVWGELDTALTPAGDTTARAAAAWFQVRPHLDDGRISGAAIIRQGYVSKAAEYAIYPAVQPDAAGNAAMVFTLTSADRFPSAAFALLHAGASDFGPPVGLGEHPSSRTA